jgi:hypothetical protein
VNDEIHLELAAKLYAVYLQEIGDKIVFGSWKTSEAIMRVSKSNHIVSVSIEVCAFLLHLFSRNLPIVEGDRLNEFVYSPSVKYCSQELGCLVEQLQDWGAFNIAVFSCDAIEAEARLTIEKRDLEYSRLPYMGLAEHASRIITTDLADGERSDLTLSFTNLSITQALAALNFAWVSQHLQKSLTPYLCAYLSKIE